MATSASFITSSALFPEAAQFFGHGSLGCVLMEHDGRIVSVTPSFATMVESDVEALFGQSVFDMLTVDGGVEPASLLADARKTKVVVRDDHSFVWSAHRIASGAALGGYYVGVLWDEGERESLSPELVHSERLSTLGGLTAGVAHEIAGPLNIIANNADLLLEEDGMMPEARKSLMTIRNEAFRLSALLQVILDFARDAPSELKALDPVALVNKSLELFNHRLNGKEVSWRVEAEAELPEVVGDAERLQQVFFNLFKNAWDALPNGGEVLIKMRRDTRNEVGEAIEFVVEDKGEGIAPSDLKRIYEPFFTTKSVGQGTGLGLAIVQRILATHQGSLRVVSSPGEGTRATVLLPVVSAADAPCEGVLNLRT